MLDMGLFFATLNIITLVVTTSTVSYIKVVGVANIASLLIHLKQHVGLLYWKLPQYVKLTRVVSLMQLSVKGWLELSYAILDAIYYFDNNRIDIFEWKSRFAAIYNVTLSNLPSGATFVTTSLKNGAFKCWVVKLPRLLNITPHEKSFYPCSKGGKEAARIAAIQYRNDTLAIYLDNFLSNLNA